MKIILWALAIISAMVLFKILWHYLSDKVLFWLYSKKFRRMAKKYPGESGDRLNKIADEMKQFSKESKLKDYIDGKE